VTGSCRLSRELQAAGSVGTIVATTVCATPSQVAQAAGQTNTRPIGFTHVTQFQSSQLHGLFVIFGVNVAGVRYVDFLTAHPNAIDVMVPIANLTQGLSIKKSCTLPTGDRMNV
jgi:mannose/fructose/N-acetylgalactosamine-specific phosphotransferase system component IIC